MSQTQNPSTATQARKALEETVKNIKKSHVQLEQNLKRCFTNQEDQQITLNRLEAENEELRSTLRDLAERQKEMQVFREDATKLILALASGQTVDQIRSSAIASALSSDDPQKYFHMLAVSDDDEINEEGGAGVEVGADSGVATLIENALASKPLKDTLKLSLFKLTGMPNYNDQSKLVYPEGLTPEDDAWPSSGVGADRVSFIRFDLTKPYDDDRNDTFFRHWCRYIRLNGPELVREVEPYLACLTDAHIEERCKKKYNYHAGKFREWKKKNSVLGQGNEASGSGAIEGAAPAPAKKSKSALTATLNTRKAGKLDVRTRQLDAMQPPPEGSGQTDWTDPKWRTFLTMGAMSDDSDEWVTDDDGTRKKTGSYETHAWDFLSKEMIEMKAAVDAVVDPEPSDKYKPRKPGSTKPGPPERHVRKEYALRKWMVDPEILAKNPEWLRGNRVVANGELWGEAEPEDKHTSQKRKKRSPSNKGTILIAEVKKTRQVLDEAVDAFGRDLGGESLGKLREKLARSSEKGKDRAADQIQSEHEELPAEDEEMDDS